MRSHHHDEYFRARVLFLGSQVDQEYEHRPGFAAGFVSTEMLFRLVFRSVGLHALTCPGNRSQALELAAGPPRWVCQGRGPPFLRMVQTEELQGVSLAVRQQE